MGATTPLVEARGLGKRFGARWIFRGVSLQVNQGDRLAILGRNGAGKSTLLKVLATLWPPSEGKVFCLGNERTQIGYAAIELALYPTLTAREHLELCADLRGRPSRHEELLEIVGLSKSASVPTHSFSTGMRARLRLAIAIQASPPVLLLDEPGASLDESGRSLLAEIIDRQTAQGCVVLATNDPKERSLATHELVLDA